MSADMSNAPYAVIVGLGATGLSCARHLRLRGWRLAVTDTRPSPPQLPALRALDALITVRTGGLAAALLEGAVFMVASPAASHVVPVIDETRRDGPERQTRSLRPLRERGELCRRQGAYFRPLRHRGDQSG